MRLALDKIQYLTTIVLVVIFFVQPMVFISADTITTTVTISIGAVCGNDVQETPEECDGSDLVGESCTSQGFASGTLSCTGSCTFDTSACVVSAPSGGGGGGAYVPPAPVETKVIFNGKGYPSRTVTLLKDAQVGATTIAGTDATFTLELADLTAGNYIFSLYSEDKNGVRSSLLTFPVSVTAGATTTVSGIFIAPTIDVDKSEVKRGDNIAIFGQVAPLADIVISVSSDEEHFAKTIADGDGIYLYNFDTTILEYGEHYTKSKGSIGNLWVSGYGPVINFKVGTENVEKESQYIKADLNNNGKVDLIDFSIVAYWYKRTLSEDFKLYEQKFLNGDGKVDLVDFSIMAYYWTG